MFVKFSACTVIQIHIRMLQLLRTVVFHIIKFKATPTLRNFVFCSSYQQPQTDINKVLYRETFLFIPLVSMPHDNSVYNNLALCV